MRWVNGTPDIFVMRQENIKTIHRVSKMKLQESASLVVDQYVGTVAPSDLLIHETLLGWLFENRIQKLIAQTKEVNTSHDSAAEHRTPSAVIKHLASQHDPTGGEYTEHLLKWYNAGHFRQEDAKSMRGLLKRYHRNKGSLPFKPSDFEKPGDLRGALDKHLGKEYKPTFSRDMRPDYVEAIQRGSEQVHDDEHFEIRKLRSKAHHLGADLEPGSLRYKESLQKMAEQDPHSRKAMQILGTGTEWCTTPERTVMFGSDRGRNTMFEHYSTQGPLYWIHDKKNNRRYVFHEGSPQFVDENNNNSYSEFDSSGKLDPIFKPIEHHLHKFNHTEVKHKIRSGLASTQELDKFFNSDSSNVRGLALVHFDAPLIHKYLVTEPHKNVYVRRDLANRKEISPDTIHHALVTKPDEDAVVRRDLSINEKISPDTIHHALVTKPDRYVDVRRNLAKSKKISPDTIHHVLTTEPAYEEDDGVIRFLSENENMSSDTIHHLLVTKPHEDSSMRRRLIKRKNMSPDTIHHLLVTEPVKDPWHKKSLEEHPNISQKTKDALGIK